MTKGWTVTRGLPVLMALGIFLLALIQPVSYADADAALTLIAAQAIVEHGAPNLEVYRNHPTLAYDLENDYRLRQRGGHIQLYDLGMPWLAAPAVVAAKILGYDMLVVEHEHALQNLLSAASAAMIFLLMWCIARLVLAPRPSLVLALVFVLGSPLISTVATGLWNLDFATIFLLIALREIVLVEAGKRDNPRWWLACLAILIAYSCRPAAGFMVLGLGAWAAARWPWHRRLVLAVVALAGGLALLALPDGLLPKYYDPERLKLVTPLGRGLVGVLMSPARGLFLFSPFLAIVVFGYLRAGWGFWRTPIAVLAIAWSAPQILFVAAKGVWWGGHSFGPRLLAELLLPAFAVCLSLDTFAWWRRPSVRWTFLLTGIAAIAIHAGSGLFNPYARLWNGRPDIDRSGAILALWRDPQFLASERSLAARELFWQRFRLRRLWVGDQLKADEHQGVFIDFGTPERSGRWTLASEAALEFAAAGVQASMWYLLTLTISTNGSQSVIPTINGRQLETWSLDGLGVQSRRILVAGQDLLTHERTQLRFQLPDARPAGRDKRQLGLFFRSLSIQSFARHNTVTFGQDRWFFRGFSSAEAGWRWSDGTRATILIPAAITSQPAYCLTLSAQGLGRQTIAVRARTPSTPATTVASWEFEGQHVEHKQVMIPPGTLRPGEPVFVELDIPHARTSGSDPRRLGIAIREISLAAVSRSVSRSVSRGVSSDVSSDANHVCPPEPRTP